MVSCGNLSCHEITRFCINWNQATYNLRISQHSTVGTDHTNKVDSTNQCLRPILWCLNIIGNIYGRYFNTPNMAIFFLDFVWNKVIWWSWIATQQACRYTCYHYDDVTWTPCSLKSPVTRLFLQQLIRIHIKETSKSALLLLCEGIHRWPVTSPHKGPGTRKKLPFDDVIMMKLGRVIVWIHAVLKKRN